MTNEAHFTLWLMSHGWLLRRVLESQAIWWLLLGSIWLGSWTALGWL